MSYQIKSEVLEGECLKTTVEYTLADNYVLEIEVAHANPNDRAAIIRGIENREIYEQRKRDLMLGLEQWCSGGPLLDFIDFPMKIRVVGDTVETSHGNSVPLADSVELYKQWKGKSVKEGHKVGDFKIKKHIHNKLVIDCSTLSRAEADRVMAPIVDSQE